MSVLIQSGSMTRRMCLAVFKLSDVI